MANYLYLDIETIPCQDKTKQVALVANAKPPANYKNEETIAKWREENAADAIAKTSFDGGLGHICELCAVFGDEQWMLGSGRDELSILRTFSEYAARAYEQSHGLPPVIVGHNVNAFDIRFIWQRAIVLGVKLPNWFPKDPKPWGNDTFDTMTAWAGQRGTVSLDNLAQYLGLGGKTGMDGSMVAQAWLDGKHDEIAAYCMSDVMLTKAIHEKFLAAGM